MQPLKTPTERNFCEFHHQKAAAYGFFGWMLDAPPLNSAGQFHPRGNHRHTYWCPCFCLCVSKWYFFNKKISWTGWHRLFCFVKGAIWHGQKWCFPVLLSTINSSITTKAYTLTTVITPVYVPSSSILSAFFIIYIHAWASLSYISQYSLISDTDLSLSPQNYRLLLFITVKYLQGDSWIIKHRSGNSTLCPPHANPVPPLSHPFRLCGFTASCFLFSGSLCYVLFLIFRAWQAEKCDLDSSNRLQSWHRCLHRCKYTESARYQSALQKQTNLSFSCPPSHCATLPSKNRAIKPF